VKDQKYINTHTLNTQTHIHTQKHTYTHTRTHTSTHTHAHTDLCGWDVPEYAREVLPEALPVRTEGYTVVTLLLRLHGDHTLVKVTL
jgi:hypothetical protein